MLYRPEHATLLPPGAFRPAAEVQSAPGLANFPKKSGVFVGRNHALADLDGAMTRPGGAVIQAVHGLGGIGKSALAVHWAVSRAADYNPIWWIAADSPAAIDAGLAALAVALQPAMSGVLEVQELRGWAVRWLAAHDQWLVILDNVSNPGDVEPLLANAPTGRYLITSRRATGWHGIAEQIRLDVLDHAEAVDLIARILTHRGPHDLDGAGDLCTELGCLPLAIEQAAAYCAEAGATPRRYLALLADYPVTMYNVTAEGGDAERTIARIWHVTLDRLASVPFAEHFLRILAWYAPDGIPLSLLNGLAEPPAILHAIGRLAAYSMLTVDGETLAVHRLVQAVTRTPDHDDPHRQSQDIEKAWTQATKQLLRGQPHGMGPERWPAWRSFLPHVDALTSYSRPAVDTFEIAELLSDAGAFHYFQFSYGRAIECLERAISSYRRSVGSLHQRTLVARNNLASVYLATGHEGRAITILEKILAAHERIAGENHPECLTTRNNLAAAYRAADRLNEAIPLYEKTYFALSETLGLHRFTMMAAHNLAAAYSDTGHRDDQAIPLYGILLAVQWQDLGGSDPDTLRTCHSLALLYDAADDMDRAIPLYEIAFAGRRRLFGDDYPDTLDSRNHLIRAYYRRIMRKAT
ncbi:tetratricopeptide repeat protein [Streptomyces luteoverticillatus]|uniref:tetratricopeptide repeat protein n=1 Tax=Streptomyces luteoverticillatus TaxID=66425 RepID=UPI0013E0101C|nr:tetratricopeptide repeat protein [Streptomyces luteoverticillatus]